MELALKILLILLNHLQIKVMSFVESIKEVSEKVGVKEAS
jgi:hypothetical protein